MRKGIAAILFLGSIGLFATTSVGQPISTVQYYITTVNATPTGGTWQVYADVSHNNDGLALFEIDVLGSNGAQITSTAKRWPPSPIDPSGQFEDGNGGRMGFNGLSSNGTLTSGNLTGIIGGQTIGYGEKNDPSDDMGILVGVGQEDRSASPQNGTQGPIDGSGTPTGISTPVWSYQPLANLPGGNGLSYSVAGTLIAQGSYLTDGGVGASLTVEQIPGGFTEVLGTGEEIPTTGQDYPGFYPAGDNVPWGDDPYEQGNSPIATATGDTIALTVPEPASVGLLMMAALSLLGRRRRPARR